MITNQMTSTTGTPWYNVKAMTPDERSLYYVWKTIRARCFCPTSKAYKQYGAAGRSMHPEWRESFDAFFKYMGVRPSKKHSIDRYPNNDGNYEPGNVRWATRAEQARNKCTSRVITIEGIGTKVLEDWAAYSGVHKTTIFCRLQRGVTGVALLEKSISGGRAPLMVDIEGVIKPLPQWALEYGLKRITLYERYKKGVRGPDLIKPARPMKHYVRANRYLTAT